MEIKIFLIIGSGVFGASTALYLIRALLNCRVLLVDKDSLLSKSVASHDVNKIIRTEYKDLVYLKLILKVRDI